MRKEALLSVIAPVVAALWLLISPVHSGAG
jgi:hypothetical protein